MRTQLVFVAAILAAALAAIDLNDKVCKEFCSEVKQARGWNKLGRAASDEQIKIYIAVSLQNTDKLDEIFWAVSDPLNEKYGQHLTFEQLNDLVAPAESTMERIFNWLDASPARTQMLDITVPASGDYVIVDISVEGAETLLSTEFYYYTHATTGMNLIRSPGPYHVPAAVNADIDFIGGVVRFPRYNHVKRVVQSERQQGGVDPIYIKQAFNIPANIQGQSNNNSQAVAQFAVYQQYFSSSDLTTFQQNYNLLQQQPTVFGSNQPNNPGDEDMLDIEFIMGVAQNIQTWVVITNGSANGGQEPFIDWIVGQKNNAKSPWVHSVSYGDDENSVSLSYADRLNAEFKLFGASGRSIFFASGDDGVGCSDSGDSFVPNFPSGLPTVTAVGGIYTNDMGRFGNSAERQSNQFIADEISSGGFSNYFNMPIYQKAAVKNFLTTQNSSVLPPSSFFNATGRAYPDIASFSENVNIVVGGGWEIVGGTSCASPVVAAVFSLVNDARLQKGKSTIGFANPLIYHLLATNSNAFFDVTVGGPNGGCGNANGFYAAPGWDPVTGVGCPNFGNLVKYATEF